MCPVVGPGSDWTLFCSGEAVRLLQWFEKRIFCWYICFAIRLIGWVNCSWFLVTSVIVVVRVRNGGSTEFLFLYFFVAFKLLFFSLWLTALVSVLSWFLSVVACSFLYFRVCFVPQCITVVTWRSSWTSKYLLSIALRDVLQPIQKWRSPIGPCSMNFSGAGAFLTIWIVQCLLGQLFRKHLSIIAEVHPEKLFLFFLFSLIKNKGFAPCCSRFLGFHVFPSNNCCDFS